ncbi:glycosyltransferase [Kluyvera sp. NPDC087067]|uniref:glycosyltransferase n=1 Tax=Kluyvera sp. NPDC087067 TaxID=3364105 RepID=UPI003802119D
MISVNLTTTYSRLELCAATVWSFYNQLILPDVINLWISKEKYLADEGITVIPEWVAELNTIKNIIKINFTTNTGPYRKVIPVLRAAKDEDIIVYADDDVIYGRAWLAGLLKTYHANGGNLVVASRIRLKKKNIFGKYKSYNLYPLQNSNTILEKDFIITGIGGCVLSKKHISESLLVLDDYMNVAPKTDDIWISKLIELSGTSVYAYADAIPTVNEIEHSNNALNISNTVRFVHNNIMVRLAGKILAAVTGYFGCCLSNNDKMIRNVDNFFKNHRK